LFGSSSDMFKINFIKQSSSLIFSLFEQKILWSASMGK
jgi:hypothetical protein